MTVLGLSTSSYKNEKENANFILLNRRVGEVLLLTTDMKLIAISSETNTQECYFCFPFLKQSRVYSLKLIKVSKIRNHNSEFLFSFKYISLYEILLK